MNFARTHNLRLVIRGGGHSYQGTSNAPDSLLVWTRPMVKIVLHDAFTPQGCEGKVAPSAAVSVGAGQMWLHTYDAVTTRGGDFNLHLGEDLAIGYLSHTDTEVRLYLEETLTFLMLTSEAAVGCTPPARRSRH